MTCTNPVRVRGRLQRAALPDTEHQDRGITLNEVRANGYWILGGSGAISSYISRGVVCRKLQAEPPQQKMAHLLEDQVEPAPLFTHCTVD